MPHHRKVMEGGWEEYSSEVCILKKTGQPVFLTPAPVLLTTGLFS